MKLKLPDWKDPKTRLKLIFYGGAGFVFLMLMTAAGFCFTCQSSFCNLMCHSMDQDVEAWSKSAHSEVNCRGCHGPGELVPFIIYELTGSPKEGLAQMTGNFETPINQHSHVAEHDELLSENCLNCHAITKRDVTPSPGVLINHKKHQDKGIGCAHCHNRVAHSGLTGYEDFMAMEGCYREGCHTLSAGGKAPGKCEVCHTKDFELKPENHREADFLPPKHSKMAKSEKEYCNMCHISQFCKDCHGLDMPHPAKFAKKDHGQMGKDNSSVCRNCHAQQQFCTACHHKGYDESQGPFDVPADGRAAQHPVLVRAKGAESCFKCHNPTYCAHCHVTGAKPASIKGP